MVYKSSGVWSWNFTVKSNHFHTVLFSVSDQIHSTLVICDSESVIVALHSTILSIHQNSVHTALLGLLHGWCLFDALSVQVIYYTNVQSMIQLVMKDHSSER